MNLESEVAKHKKKKESSVSKSKTKSDHKHEYEDVLYVCEDQRYQHPAKGQRCIICGKVNGMTLYEIGEKENGKYDFLSPEELYKKYENLKKIYIKDWFQKFT